MKIRTYLALGISAAALVACGAPSTAPPVEVEIEDLQEITNEPHPLLADVATADYSLDKTHAFLTVKVGHNGGITQYRISFTDIDGDLAFDSQYPEESRISFSINPAIVETNYPGDYAAGHPDSQWSSWNEDVSRDAKWLNSDAHPEITFVSTSAAHSGDLSGTVTGDLSLLGVTKPVTLDVSYNGVANPPRYGERDVIGFDASTKLNRSDFGMAAYIPNIGDEVTVEFSGEFVQDE